MKKLLLILITSVLKMTITPVQNCANADFENGTLSGWTQLQFVSTLQGYFLPSDLFILFCQYTSGLQTKLVFHYYLISLPLLFVALLIGNKLSKKIPEGKFNTYIYILLLMIGIVFVTHALYQLSIQNT